MTATKSTAIAALALGAYYLGHREGYGEGVSRVLYRVSMLTSLHAEAEPTTPASTGDAVTQLNPSSESTGG